MGSGSSKSKKGAQKEPSKFFERERWKEEKREEKRKKKANPVNKRLGVKELPPLPSATAVPGPGSGSAGGTAAPTHVRSYDEEALDRMRYQLKNDSDAFLLNNILLSVQFFENYEREAHHIKNNPLSEREHLIDEAMVRRHKHVFFADRLQTSVHEHVMFSGPRGSEPLVAPRLFVIYDNVEASEPGDTSDYSAVLDAPFYKLRVEDCKEPGYVRLKKLEVLESIFNKDDIKSEARVSGDSVYTDSEKESYDSDDSIFVRKGEDLLQQLELKLIKTQNFEGFSRNSQIKINQNAVDISGRRCSGPIKQLSSQAEKNNILNISDIKKRNIILPELTDKIFNHVKVLNDDGEIKPRKSILKFRRPSGPLREPNSKLQYTDIRKNAVENTIAEDTESTETSGYRSTSSSRQNESSENESDYGYSTITESSTPKRLVLSVASKYSVDSGVLPEECWTTVQVRALDHWSDDDDYDETDDTASKTSSLRNLYETYYFLSSRNFMNNFVDNFIINLGSCLGVTQDAINNALTQGASIYCDTIKHGNKISCEVFPALIAAWPNAANQWIIRERKIIKNPRNNFSYQWPTKYMVGKAIGFGCLLVPIGFRPKRGLNPELMLQWRIIFPAAERYLESCLAHSHIRCYLFALALHKSFMENETSKIGIDCSHIKNHLFWQCEDNYAKWPEDRLGETLRLFLRTFYVHFGQARFPNYFIENRNDFKSIPKPLLLKLQRKLADILESPVIYTLSALNKIKYTKKDFYPTFNSYKLYEILTRKNPLRILNPNLPISTTYRKDSSESEEESPTNLWGKNRDKQYQWNKERQRQMQERRKALLYVRKNNASNKQEKVFDTKIILPKKMDPERRRLVLELFISHFIAMARSSERFKAKTQAVIYLEQAQRLCILLSEEPGGDNTVNEYMDVIQDKLADCKRMLVNQEGFNLPPRTDSQMDRSAHKTIQKLRPKYDHIINQDSPIDAPAIAAFTFVDVHMENDKYEMEDDLKLNGTVGEESKL